MTKAGRPVAVRRWRAFGARTAVAAACPLMLFASACASCGSDSDSPTRPSDPPRAYGAGSLVQADALGNTVIGGSNRTALSFRFRATWTGSVVAVRCYVIKNVNGRTGYSNGDGGIMRVTLQPDSGRKRHVPVGRHLATATFRPADQGFFPLLRFDEPARIVAGRRYHVVFSNVDPAPARNYVSINALYSASRLGRGPAVPPGLGVLERDSGGRWAPRRSGSDEDYLPIFGVVGGRSGQHDGVGYMEVWDPKPIGAEAMVRQVLRTPAGRSLRVDSVWLRVRRRAGARAPLMLRLERPDGLALASASLAPRDVPSSDAGWVRARFSAPVSLAAGSELALTASAATGSSYEAFPIRKGTGFGFDRKTFFNAGYAEFNDGTGWIGWDQWGARDRRNSDLQFALGVVR